MITRITKDKNGIKKYMAYIDLKNVGIIAYSYKDEKTAIKNVKRKYNNYLKAI